MSAIQWTEDYSVQVARFDHEHQMLFKMVNDLHEASKAGHGTDIVEEILGRLIAYTAKHFAGEEEMMEKNGFPGLAEHRREHQALVTQALQFQKDLGKGKLLVAVSVMTFLKHWLTNHIHKTDKKYGPFLNSKGVH
ncbi:MAG: bacteriohemerythrin [Terriglobales bacterium]